MRNCTNTRGVRHNQCTSETTTSPRQTAVTTRDGARAQKEKKNPTHRGVLGGEVLALQRRKLALKRGAMRGDRGLGALVLALHRDRERLLLRQSLGGLGALRGQAVGGHLGELGVQLRSRGQVNTRDVKYTRLRMGVAKLFWTTHISGQLDIFCVWR